MCVPFLPFPITMANNWITQNYDRNIGAPQKEKYREKNAKLQRVTYILYIIKHTININIIFSIWKLIYSEICIYVQCWCKLSPSKGDSKRSFSLFVVVIFQFWFYDDWMIVDLLNQTSKSLDPNENIQIFLRKFHLLFHFYKLYFN